LAVSRQRALRVWIDQECEPWNVIRRKLRFIGVTSRAKTSPNTFRWHQHAEWTRQLPARSVRNVSLDHRVWSSGFLRGYSALQGGEESDSCAAGQGRRFAARRTAVDIRPTAVCMVGDARLAITKPVGSTAGLAGSQVCGACVRHLGGTPSLALTGDATGVEAENSTREGRIPLLQLGEMSTYRSSVPAVDVNDAGRSAATNRGRGLPAAGEPPSNVMHAVNSVKSLS